MSAEDTDFYQEHTHQRLPTTSILVVEYRSPVNMFSATIQQPVFVNQLFVNNQRVVRARVSKDDSDYLQYATPLKDPSQARYGFQYQPGQFDYYIQQSI